MSDLPAHLNTRCGELTAQITELASQLLAIGEEHVENDGPTTLECGDGNTICFIRRKTEEEKLDWYGHSK